LELTIGAALKRKLEHARDLMSHANPTGDLEVVMERALDLLIDQLERRRFATTLRPSPEQNAPVSSAPVAPARAVEMKTDGSRAHISSAPVAPARAATEMKTGGSRPHIGNAVRRHVAIRDEQRCTFVGPDGHRCGARSFLQVHHERPFALGGADTPDNLRLLCAAHNRFLAERCPVAEHAVRTPAPQACPDKLQAPHSDEPQKKVG
jgi:hypothetical protein